MVMCLSSSRRRQLILLFTLSIVIQLSQINITHYMNSSPVGSLTSTTLRYLIISIIYDKTILNDKKIEPWLILNIYLNLNDNSKAYHIHLPSYKKIQITQDVIFDKTKFLINHNINTKSTIDSLEVHPK